MGEMIERIVAAIDLNLGGIIDSRDDSENAEIDRRMRLAARAVINAMQEPTNEMIKAAEQTLWHLEGEVMKSTLAREVYRTMFSAALLRS